MWRVKIDRHLALCVPDAHIYTQDEPPKTMTQCGVRKYTCILRCASRTHTFTPKMSHPNRRHNVACENRQASCAVRPGRTLLHPRRATKNHDTVWRAKIHMHLVLCVPDAHFYTKDEPPKSATQ